MSNHHRTMPRQAKGFTLIEMMVVIGLIALLAAMSMPGIVSLMNSGSDAQAYNMIAAQITAARALAIERVSFAGVHCQIADAKDAGGNLLRPKQEDVCYTGIVFVDDSNSITSPQKLFTGYSAPKPLPGGIAFGQVTSGMTGGGFTDTATVGTNPGAPYTGAAVVNKALFTTFTVVFTAFGSAVKSVDGGPVVFYSNDPLFSDAKDTKLTTSITGSRRVWDYTNAGNVHYATTAMALFQMNKYITSGSSDKLAYLNESAQILPLNIYTGQLYARE